MTEARPMFNPFLSAGEVTPPSWQGIVLGVLGGGGITAAFGLINKWVENRASRKNKQDEGQSTVRVEQIKVEATERAALLVAWQDKEKRTESELLQIRNEMGGMRRTFGHEIRNLQQYNATILDMYHACYGVLQNVILQCRIMRARLKRMTEDAGGKFDEDEFPPIDMTGLNPKDIPKFQPTNGWDDPSPNGDSKKITGFVSISDPDGKP